jgi:hypothetical protein
MRNLVQVSEHAVALNDLELKPLDAGDEKHVLDTSVAGSLLSTIDSSERVFYLVDPCGQLHAVSLADKTVSNNQPQREKGSCCFSRFSIDSLHVI